RRALTRVTGAPMVTHRRRSSGAGPRALTAARGLRHPTPRKAEHPTVPPAGSPNLLAAKHPNLSAEAYPNPPTVEHPTVAAGYPNLPTAEQPNATDRAPSRVQPPVAPTPRQTRTLRRAFQPSAVIPRARPKPNARVLATPTTTHAAGKPTSY